MAITFMYLKYLFTIFPHLFNPLNYARKHRYPERCSSLTYWEEDIPPRIDLGMSKNDGPFTVEEVEDVKTLLGLLPVLMCGGGFNGRLHLYRYTILEGESLLYS